MRCPTLLATAILLAACAEVPAAAPPAPSAAPVTVVAARPSASAAPAPASPPTTAPAPSAAPPPPSTGTFAQLGPADEQRLVTPHLDGKKLAHPAFRGPFGPAGDNVVALTATADAPPADLAGFVVLADGRVLPLPRLHDHWSLWEVNAILFEDVDGDGARDLVVLAEFITGAGPQGAAPFHASAVVRWDGRAFVRVPDVEKRLERLGDAAAVKKALRTAPKGRSR
jgi:hypothetical protein